MAPRTGRSSHRDQDERDRAAVLCAGPVPSPSLGEGPRVDVVELACALRARLSFPASGGAVERLERRVAGFGLRHVVRERVRGAGLFVSLSEEVGLPLALLDRGRTPHVLVAHNLTTPRRRALEARLGWLDHLDAIVVLARSQERYLVEEVGLPAQRVHLVHDKVDHRFFRPGAGRAPGPPRLLSVGREQRDYETLLAAVAPLALPTTIVHSSLWAQGPGELPGRAPSHVTVRSGLSHRELRGLYDAADVVVVPLRAGVEYAAGVNAVLVAMAMGKPVIVSRTPGIADHVRDGVDGLLVPPGEPEALRAAIGALVGEPARAAALARAARSLVETERNLDRYVGAISAIAADVRTARRAALPQRVAVPVLRRRGA